MNNAEAIDLAKRTVHQLSRDLLNVQTTMQQLLDLHVLEQVNGCQVSSPALAHLDYLGIKDDVHSIVCSLDTANRLKLALAGCIKNATEKGLLASPHPNTSISNELTITKDQARKLLAGWQTTYESPAKPAPPSDAGSVDALQAEQQTHKEHLRRIRQQQENNHHIENALRCQIMTSAGHAVIAAALAKLSPFSPQSKEDVMAETLRWAQDRYSYYLEQCEKNGMGPDPHHIAVSDDELRHYVRARVNELNDIASPMDRNLARSERYISLSKPDKNGMVRINGRLTPETAAALSSTLTAHVRSAVATQAEPYSGVGPLEAQDLALATQQAQGSPVEFRETVEFQETEDPAVAIRQQPHSTATGRGQKNSTDTRTVGQRNADALDRLIRDANCYYRENSGKPADNPMAMVSVTMDDRDLTTILNTSELLQNTAAKYPGLFQAINQELVALAERNRAKEDYADSAAYGEVNNATGNTAIPADALQRDQAASIDGSSGTFPTSAVEVITREVRRAMLRQNHAGRSAADGGSSNKSATTTGLTEKTQAKDGTEQHAECGGGHGFEVSAGCGKQSGNGLSSEVSADRGKQSGDGHSSEISVGLNSKTGKQSGNGHSSELSIGSGNSPDAMDNTGGTECAANMGANISAEQTTGTSVTSSQENSWWKDINDLGRAAEELRPAQIFQDPATGLPADHECDQLLTPRDVYSRLNTPIECYPPGSIHPTEAALINNAVNRQRAGSPQAAVCTVSANELEALAAQQQACLSGAVDENEPTEHDIQVIVTAVILSLTCKFQTDTGICLTLSELSRLGISQHYLLLGIDPATVKTKKIVVNTRGGGPLFRSIKTAEQGVCAMPGSDTPIAQCDLHHVVAYSHNGPTSLDNLVAVSRSHHSANDDSQELKLKGHFAIDQETGLAGWINPENDIPAPIVFANFIPEAMLAPARRRHAQYVYREAA